MPAQNDPTYFKLSDVLRKEFKALRRSEQLKSPSTDTEIGKLKSLYRLALDEHCLSALALSGGGIRSACVALGVIQSLAEARLLPQLDYLSTVSGGGYIGSWLSAWLYWERKEAKKREQEERYEERLDPAEKFCWRSYPDPRIRTRSRSRSGICVSIAPI
jgi:predicted acylesterase/phospholipase RssA